MPVNIVVEDGTGVIGANALTTLDFADQYAEDRGIAAWTGTDDQKASAIILATDFLRRYAGRWKGHRTFVDQTLDWPRAGVLVDETDLESIAVFPLRPSLALFAIGYLPDDEIPWAIQASVVELAVRARTGVPLIPDQSRGGRIKQETVGPLTTVYADDAPAGRTYPAATSFLAPYLRADSFTSARLVRG
jgi:hypothetical protein